MSANTNITSDQITSLRKEAAIAGDYYMCMLCRLAADDVEWAIQECAQVIANAQGMDEEV